MPPRIREFIAELKRAGFGDRGGRGSHGIFVHPKLAEPITIQGSPGEDARHYRNRAVHPAIEDSKNGTSHNIPQSFGRNRAILEDAMIDYDLDTIHSVLYVRPRAALAAEDFAKLASVVDPHIEATGDLAGIVIETQSFPGWEDLGAMASHFRFVREHHRRVRKIAVVTDSALGKVAEQLVSHFVSAEIKRFPSGEVEAARQWIFRGP